MVTYISLAVLTVVSLSSLILCGYIIKLSFKERHELNNRLMCKSVDDFARISDSEKEKVTNPMVSTHRRLINNFKRKGVYDG